jgi:hypothetical protein
MKARKSGKKLGKGKKLEPTKPLTVMMMHTKHDTVKNSISNIR